MINYVKVANLQVAPILYEFIDKEALLDSGLSTEQFWTDFAELITIFSPINKQLLATRDIMQEAIHQWHKEHKADLVLDRNNTKHSDINTVHSEYKKFLQQIGYLETAVDDFQITTDSVDLEICYQAGPQLVVPINNARYAINAANARWGSLYDALYGTNVIEDDNEAELQGGYNPLRGTKVIAYAKDFLDSTIPLSSYSHQDAIQYSITDGHLLVKLENGHTTGLADNQQLIGYSGSQTDPAVLLFCHNRLHFEIQIDRTNSIGMIDKAGVKDILMEAALTTIMDCEDSVVAVDAEDKVIVYRNWLGLMNGSLSTVFTKDTEEVRRTLNPDRQYTSLTGEVLRLPGRSVLFIRHVGHLMTTNAILDSQGQEIPEGIMDAVITSLIALQDLKHNGRYLNSKKGSVYIVKPKMHGSTEVAFTNQLFSHVERMLHLQRNTLKIGLMDEERRTSLNLKACIREVSERIVFINTGFLDRTGDEIHTSMEAGPMILKEQMKSSRWLQGYERANVGTGLECGLQGRAQIGKGMWTMPELMNEMMRIKINQLKAGCNTAWVPSPTAATLHALHYHKVDILQVQDELKQIQHDYLDEILLIPIMESSDWTPEQLQQELNNNAQGILGYVVRWVEQGIGCSRVPDIHHIGLMEDRATLRISSQHMANWLHHGICTADQIIQTLKNMAVVVDAQNEGDSAYQSMANDFDKSIAFQTACELILQGYKQPNGYTEPILHRRRMEFKNSR